MDITGSRNVIGRFPNEILTKKRYKNVKPTQTLMLVTGVKPKASILTADLIMFTFQFFKLKRDS